MSRQVGARDAPSEMRLREHMGFLVKPVKTMYEGRGSFDEEGEFFCPPNENGVESNTPDILACRFAALRLHRGYVVYDRLLSRIVDGVYYGEHALHNALGVAQYYNEGHGKPDMSPNGIALGLKYPTGHELDTEQE